MRRGVRARTAAAEGVRHEQPQRSYALPRA